MLFKTLSKYFCIVAILLLPGIVFATDLYPTGNINFMNGDGNIWNPYDINAYHDLNIGHAVYAPRYFGDGSGLTNVGGGTVTWADLNLHMVPYVGATHDVNLYNYDLNAKSITALAFFGSGIGLTGILSQSDVNKNYYGILDVNRMFHSIFDLNLFYYKMTDVNTHFVGKIDLNNNFYGKLDVNAHFAPKLNPTFLGIAKFPSGSEANPSIAFTTNSGTGFWSTAGQTIEFSVDSVKYVAMNNIVGQELSVTGSVKASGDVTVGDDLNVARDSNFFVVNAGFYFGNGAGLTGVTGTTNWADVNAHLVPYVGADYDVNLNGHDLNAAILYADKFATTDANSVRGLHAVALGWSNTAFGDQSTAIGSLNQGVSEGTIAIGSENIVQGSNSVGLGSRNRTKSNEGVAIGSSTMTLGIGSIAIGHSSENEYAVTSAGMGSIAGGYSDDVGKSIAGGKGAIALGYNTKAFGDGSVSLGYDNNAGVDYATAIGYKVFNVNPKSVALGYDVNIAHDLNVMNDVNVLGDINAKGNIQAARFFGDGSGLTGIASSGGTVTMDANVNEYNWLTTDLNKNYYGKLDVNRQFVPYIGATRDVNLGIKGLVSGDANIGSVQYWEITQKDIGGGTMYPALIPHGDIGKYGLIEGGLTVSAPTGAADVVLGLYDSTFTNSWYFIHNISDGLFSLGKNGTTAPFFINSKTAVVGDFNATGDVNVGEDVNIVGSVKATAFFGSGAGLTGVTASTNWADINAHVYGKLDVNAHFVPYLSATKDVNLNFKDLNVGNFKANRITATDITVWSIKFPTMGGYISGAADVMFFVPRNAGASITFETDGDGTNLYVKPQATGKNYLGLPVFPWTSMFATGDINGGSATFTEKAYLNKGAIAKQDVNVSSGVNKGVSILADANKICFPSNSCEMYIDYNSTAMIFGS
jgi:hypothetical protein